MSDVSHEHRYIQMCHKGASVIGDRSLQEQLLASNLALPYWSAETKVQELDAYRMYFKIRQRFKSYQNLQRVCIMKRSLERIQALVDYAYTCIPFYREFYKKAGFRTGEIRSFKDFKALPLLNKDGMRELYQSQIDHGIQAPYRSSTSGSTGQPVMLLNDEIRTCYTYAFLLNMLEHMLGRRICEEDWIYNVYYEPFYLSHAFGNFKTFNIGVDVPVEIIAKHVRALKPRLITGVANRVLELIDCLPDISSYGVELVSTNSESSPASLRRKIEEQTGISVLDEYSSEELGIMAWEDRKTKDYLVAEDALFLEMIDTDHFGTNMQEVVGTCFNSMLMPRIRYVQGDFAEWAEGSCEADIEISQDIIGPRCLKRICGRADMSLVRVDGTPLQGSQVLGLVDRHLLKASQEIKKFRLIQKNHEDIDLLLLGTSSENAKHSIRNFVNSLEESMGRGLVRIKTKWVDEIPTIKNKHRCIIREF